MNWLSLSALAICPNLLIKALGRKSNGQLPAIISWIWSFCVIGAIGIWLSWWHNQPLESHHRTVLILTTLICLLSMIPWCTNIERDAVEINIMLLCIGIGVFVTVTAGLVGHSAGFGLGWMQCYLGIEMQTIPISIMLASRWRQKDSNTTCAMRSFIMNTIASGFFLLGISYCMIHRNVNQAADIPPMLLIGQVMIAVALLFKTTIMPFHLWAIDAYNAASYRIIAVLSVLPKLSVFVYLLLTIQKSSIIPTCFTLLGFFAVIFCTVAMVMQSEIKRFLAYSGMVHMAYLAIYIFSTQLTTSYSSIAACTVILKYLMSYTCAMIPLAIVLLCHKNINLSHINHLAGFGRKKPLLGIVLSASLLSLCGLPPTMGFWAKLMILKDLITMKVPECGTSFWHQILCSGGKLLALHITIFSVIACYGYLKILKTMYIDPSDQKVSGAPFTCNIFVKTCIILCTFCNAFFILNKTLH